MSEPVRCAACGNRAPLNDRGVPAVVQGDDPICYDCARLNFVTVDKMIRHRSWKLELARRAQKRRAKARRQAGKPTP